MIGIVMKNGEEVARIKNHDMFALKVGNFFEHNNEKCIIVGTITYCGSEKEPYQKINIENLEEYKKRRTYDKRIILS